MSRPNKINLIDLRQQFRAAWIALATLEEMVQRPESREEIERLRLSLRPVEEQEFPARERAGIGHHGG